MMSDCAKITVTSGPDRGKVFELAGEMLRLGKSPENDVVFSDSQMGDHHASIVRREGRFAIFTSLPEGLEVDGTEVPAECWVWLPETATIRVGGRTSVEFKTNGSGAHSQVANGLPIELAGAFETNAAPSATFDGPPRTPGKASISGVVAGQKSATPKGRRSTDAPPRDTTPPGSDGPGRPRRSAADRGEKKSRTLARFITDGPGDPLVKLGEDGHLPELMLREARAGERAEAGPKQSNTVVLVVAIGLSFGMTILMLFMDMGSFGNNAEEKARARRDIAEYYGGENADLQPYQLHLREARLARSRRDFETERQEYRKVLALLRSEAKDKLYRYTGLTGRLDYDESSDNKKSDKHLEELIGVLLSD